MTRSTQNNLVVKDNALIEASYKLSLVEQRLVLLAILEARSQNKPLKGEVIRIHSSVYMQHFSVDRHAGYKAMRDAASNLFEAFFQWDEVINGHLTTHKNRWVQHIAYSSSSGFVSLVFADQVLPLITELEKNFTSYEIEQVRGLSSNYAIRLYELLIKWRSTGKTPYIDLQGLRLKLGLPDTSYTTMGDFKNRVLDLSIKQINQNTDILASYEQHKNGRTIIGFTFSFKPKPAPEIIDHKPKKPKPAKPDPVYNNMALSKIAEYAEAIACQPAQMNLWGLVGGQGKMLRAITNELMTPEGYQKWLPELKALGHQELI